MLMALCVIYCSLVRTKKTPVAIHKAAMAPTNAIKAAINIFLDRCHRFLHQIPQLPLLAGLLVASLILAALAMIGM